MKIVLNTFKIIFLSIFFFIFLEIFTRLILFIPTNISVFSYGFKNSVFFEIVDLSKFQIIIADKEKKLINSKKLKFDEKKIWIFGGSTTHGYACEAKQSSSWPDELFKLDNNFKFRNFAFHGADTDQQINLSGILGQLTKENILSELSNYMSLFMCVFVGGLLGNYLNLKIFTSRILAIVTSLLVIFVSIRMGIRIFL